jgi:hypothetical protein
MPLLKRVIEDWVSLCILADRKEEKKQRFYQRVWDVIETSLPILIHSTESKLTLSEPNVWKVRVLSHKVDGKCIDIRQFRKIENLTNVEYEPTDNGLTLPIKDWFVILDTVLKYLRKYK